MPLPHGNQKENVKKEGNSEASMQLRGDSR